MAVNGPFRCEGREIYIGSRDLTLVVTVHPHNGYAGALGLAARITDLLNAAEGILLGTAVNALLETRK